MIKLYPDQLRAQLDKKLHTAYLLLGNDHFLLQESRDFIRQKGKTQGFLERHTFQVDNDTNWKIIFSLCQSKNLFSERQILEILLSDSSINATVNKQMLTLVKLLHKDLLLIVQVNKQERLKDGICWLNQLTRCSVLIICQTPKYMKFFNWIEARAKKHCIYLDKDSYKLLCYYYEGNLLATNQILEQLALLWPNKKITPLQVEQVIEDSSHFTPFHWVDALLEEKIQRSFHILQQLRLEEREPLILLRVLQHELLLIITIKRQLAYNPIYTVFDKYKIWQNRRILFKKALNRLNQDQLRQALYLMVRLELTIKQNYNQSVWLILESLSLLLCNKPLANVFIRDYSNDYIKSIIWRDF